MVAALLTVLTLSVLQLALALHVRTTVQDAASEGARAAALADADLPGGARRASELIATALGPGYDAAVTATSGESHGRQIAVVTVRSTFPVLGLIGLERGMEVTGRAVVETYR